MVENPPPSLGDTGSIPDQGTKIPHAMGQVSLRTSARSLGATAREKPVCCNEEPARPTQWIKKGYISTRTSINHCSMLRYFFLDLFYALLFSKNYLFLAVLGLCCCPWAFSNCSERSCSLVALHGLLIVVASLAAEHRLSSCVWVLVAWGMWGLPWSGIKPMSPALAGGFFFFFYHWAIKEALIFFFTETVIFILYICVCIYISVHIYVCIMLSFHVIFSSVRSLSRVWIFVTPWTAASQASLSII